MNKKIINIVFFMLISFVLYAVPKKVVDISVNTQNVPSDVSSYLRQAVADKLEANLSKYTDLLVINSSNGEAFDEENPDYMMFLTIRRMGNVYIISARCTNLTTRETMAMVVSEPRSSEQDLYSKSGSAVDEITISLCKALGYELSYTDKSYLLHGEVGLTDKEEESNYFSEIDTYNDRID